MTSSTYISLLLLSLTSLIVLVYSAPIDSLKPQLPAQPTPQAKLGTNPEPVAVDHPVAEPALPESPLESTEHTNVPTKETKDFVIEPRKEEEPTELPEVTSNKDTSTFSCSGKVTGYYADVKLGCRVYHFCTQMDTISGVASYQRMSYMCLEDSFFDQKDLNCVKKDQLTVPCDRAEAEYESSNRQFDEKEEKGPSLRDNLAANIMMNPIARYIAGR